MRDTNGMGEKQFSFYTILAIVVILGYLCYRILLPFLAPLSWAVVFCIVFFPVYRVILRYVRLQSLAATATVVLVCILILGPFSYFTYLLTVELSGISTAPLDMKTIAGLFNHPLVRHATDRLLSFFNISQAELQASVLSGLSSLGKRMLEYAPGRLGDVLGAAFNFLLMAFSLFFFFQDGPYLIGRLSEYLPFSRPHKDRLTKQVKDIVISTIYGGIVVALALGCVGSISFSLVGLHGPGIWGLAIAISSFIPFVGSAIVWIPAILWLLFKGAFAKAIILFLIATLATALIDNIIRPVIIGNRLRMPLLVIFFGALGGVGFFGLIGIVMGPLVLAVFISMLDIFKDVEGDNE
jgi:predicted PurR-regulated permease PerM